jgi:hypothetical protein
VRDTAKGSSTEIRSPPNCKPYPDAREKVSDSPIEDKGRNFGRIARNRIMDEYVEESKKINLLGIPVNHWLKFLKEN